MDVGTGIAILGPSALTLRLLGPTADYIGGGVEQWARRQVENVQRIFDAAAHKIEPQDLDEAGAVPPRVLKGVLDEGSFIEDDVAAEYFAGVLAGSRSPEGADDRGVATIDVLSGLSSLQIRAHYVLYRAAQAIAAAHPEVNWHTTNEERTRLSRLAIPTEQLVRALAIPDAIGMTFTGAMSHILIGLQRTGLIDGFALGSAQHLRSAERSVQWPDHGLVFRASTFGIEIYCAAHGFTADPVTDWSRPHGEFVARFKTEVASAEALIVLDLPSYVEPSDP